MKNNKIKFEMHIDCDPRIHLQEQIARSVFKVLGQPYRNPDSTFFGDWVWVDIETDEQTHEHIGKMLIATYDDGLTRYVQW